MKLKLKWIGELIGDGCLNRSIICQQHLRNRHLNRFFNMKKRSPCYTLLCILLVVSGGCRVHSEPNNSLPSVTINRPISKPVTEHLDLTGTVGTSSSGSGVQRDTGLLERANLQDSRGVESSELAD